MNNFDIILIILIALVTIRGIFRGLITELIVLISLILGIFVAFTYLTPATNLVLTKLPEIPEFAVRIIVFIVLFLTVNLAVRFIGKMLNKFASLTFLQPVNRLAGGLFAFGKIILIISVIFILVGFIPFSNILMKKLGAEESLLYKPILAFAPAFYRILTSILPVDNQFQQNVLDSFQSADSTVKRMINPF